MSRKGWLLFIAISVFWGIPYLFIKIAVRELDPSVVVFARVGIAAVVLVPVALFRGTLQQLRKQWRALIVLSCVPTVVLLPLAVMRLPNRVPARGVMVSLLVLGLICTALAYLTFYALVSEVGASRGTVFTYVNPVVSVFLGVTLLGEPLNAAMVAGFILIIAGSWLSTGGALPLPLRHLLRRGLQSEARREAGETRQDTFH